MESRSNCCSWCNQEIPEEQLAEIAAKEDAFRAETIRTLEAKHTAKLAALNELLHDMKRRLNAAGPKRIGRPTKTAEPGERFQIGVRVTPEMKARLDAAAIKSTRSLSQEAEFRLEWSFDREDLLEEVLQLAFGKRAAGLILMIAHTMVAAGSAHVTHRDKTNLNEDSVWIDDAVGFNHAAQAAIWVLYNLHPDGAQMNTGEGLDHTVALDMVNALRGEKPIDEVPRGDAIETIRRLLGPVAHRSALRDPHPGTAKVLKFSRGDQ